MPLTVDERATSRRVTVGGQTRALTRLWTVFSTPSEDEAYDALLRATPPFTGRLVRTRADVDPQGGGVWYGETEYTTADPASAVMPEGQEPPATGPSGQQAPAPGEPLGPAFSFSTSGATAHVTQSIRTWEAVGANGGAAPNFDKAIGVDKDTVHGVDVFVGKLELSVQVTRPAVTLDYIYALRDLTGTTNTSPFYGFGDYDVLYLGADGECGTDYRWTVTHKFAVGKKETDIDVGNGIVIAAKRAWEYLWCRYSDAVRNGHGVQVPIAAYVEQVYPDGDFALLEIGE